MHDAVLVGAGGGIGKAILIRLIQQAQINKIHCFYRNPDSVQLLSDKQIVHKLDYLQINESPLNLDQVFGPVKYVIIASGTLLASEQSSPERSFGEFKIKNAQEIMQINCFGPLMAAAQVLNKIDKDLHTRVAIFSARVGSTSDNRLGGWHSYRISKAALNMGIKNLAIEYKRRFKNLCIFGYHPGTVRTPLSENFISPRYKNKVLEPESAAGNFLHVLNKVTPSDTGRIFDWKAEEVFP